MYFNTDKRTPKLHQDDLSRFFSLVLFKINSVGFWHSDTDTKANYTSNDIEFVYYTKGGSFSIIDQVEYECRCRDLMILPPNSLATSINQGYPEYEYFYIHFNVEPYQLEHVFVNHLTHKTHVLAVQNAARIQNVIQVMIEEIEKKEEGYQSVIDGCLRNLCVYLLRNQDFHMHPQKSTQGQRDQRQFVSDVVKAIALNLDQPLRIQELARQFNVSESYLYKSFTSQLQLSPQQYIKKKRLDFAMKALRSHDYTVSEVAMMVGFNSVAAFSNDIRKQTGMTPKEIMAQQEEPD